MNPTKELGLAAMAVVLATADIFSAPPISPFKLNA